MASQLTISGMSAGLNSGTVQIGPITYSPTNSMCERFVLNLASGDNTVTVPPLASAVLIVVPNTSNTIKVRTSIDSGDAGVQVAGGTAGFPVFLPFTGLSPTSVIINAGGTVNGVELTFV